MKKNVSFSREYGGHQMEEVFLETDTPGMAAPLIPLEKILEGIKGGAVCIAAQQCSETIANDMCGTFNHREIRQYVLLSDKKSAGRILGQKYIRILNIPQTGMALVHILNKKSKAWIFSDASARNGYEVSGEDVYRSFCNLFWSKDIVCEYRGDSVERNPESPLTQDISLDDRCSMPGQILDVMERYRGELFLQDVNSDVDSDRYDHLHVAEMPGSERACRSSNGSADLFMKGSVSGFSLVGDGNAGYLLPSYIDADAVNWSISLKPAAYQAMSKAFGCTWRYVQNTPLADTVGKRIRYADTFAKVVPIESESAVDAEYRCSSIEEYQSIPMIEKSYMATVDERRPAAARIEYRVTALPPQVPSGAARDKLHSDWETVSKQWKTELEGLKADCGKYCEMASALGGKYAISYGNRKDDLNSQIEALAKPNIGILSKPKRDQLVGEYESLCEKCEQFRTDCDKAVKEDKFNADRQRKISNLQNDIVSLEDTVARNEESLKKLKSSGAKDKVINKASQALDYSRRNLENKKVELERAKQSQFKYEESALHSGNRLVAKKFSFPSEELPVYADATLYSMGGVRYISIPDSSEESCLTDSTLIQDVKRLNAKLVVRE